MVNNRNTLVLYTTATCNLNCRYCYIDKNKALIEIDNILDESFKGSYYEEFIEEMFPDNRQLERLETWGGEPFLRMDRLHNTLRRIIPKHPNLNQLFSSTNMAFDDWINQFFGLMNVLGEFTDRQFFYQLQVSLDGPEEITDETRGIGTTQKLLDNFNKMLSMLGDNLPNNINLSIVFKPTLDLSTLRRLDTADAVIDYYRIFDDLIDGACNLGFNNVSAGPSVPNMACPCMSTKDDGEFFTELCKITREIEERICNGDSIFKRYQIITPFAHGRIGDLPLSLKYPNYTCGTGYTTLGLLPGHMVSTCHNGFVDIISDYKKLVTANDGNTSIDAKLFLSSHKSRQIFHKDDYAKYEGQMMCFNCDNTSARVATIAAQIIMLAEADEILPIYKDPEAATKAAIFYQSHTSFCVRDNHRTTGSLTTIHNGLLKFLFNGAHQLLEREGDVNWVEN